MNSGPDPRPWFATASGLRSYFWPTFVLPLRRQKFATGLFHFGLGLFALPFWVRDLVRTPPEVRRILYVGRYHLGDVLMLVPGLKLAREHLPNAWSALVVQSRYTGEFDLSSVADEVIAEIDETLPFLRQVRLWMKRYRSLNIDCVVFHRFTRPDLPAAVAALLVGIPHRVGGAEKGVQSLLTTVYSPHRREKVVEYHWNLVSKWLGIEQSPPRLLWPELLPLAKQLPVYDVIIAPFAQHSKVWPNEAWHALLNELGSRSLRVAVSGPPSSANEADELLRGFPWVQNLCRRSASLRVFFESVAAARSVITVDTGIRHVAAMLGVPCVVIGHGREHRQIMDAYVPTERYLWNEVPCAPCGAEPCPLGHLQCIRGIAPRAVLEAWASLNTSSATPDENAVLIETKPHIDRLLPDD
jgi:ADP-heptose:LPS heptosyltransferase